MCDIQLAEKRKQCTEFLTRKEKQKFLYLKSLKLSIATIESTDQADLSLSPGLARDYQQKRFS